MNPDDVAAVQAAAADYVEGWYNGDRARMDRALHDDLAKRMFVVDEGSGEASFRTVTKAEMLEMTAAGGGASPDPEFEVFVDDISESIAAARTVSPEYVDYLQLAKTAEGWKIANVLFRIR